MVEFNAALLFKPTAPIDYVVLLIFELAWIVTIISGDVNANDAPHAKYSPILALSLSFDGKNNKDQSERKKKCVYSIEKWV